MGFYGGGGGGGISNVVEDTTPQLGGDLDLNGNNIDFPSTANIADVLDQDDMSSNSATSLATQQSIKAYVDTGDASMTTTAKSSVYLGSDQSTGNTDVITKVTLNTEVYDPGSNFDNSTNYNFTAPVTGYYLVSASIRFGSHADQDRVELWIYVNNAQAKMSQTNAASTADAFVRLVDVFYVTSGQTIDLRGRNRDSNTVFRYIGAAYATAMTVHLLST